MQTQFFERPEGTLAYSDYGGGGELVLMLPGMGALRSEYRYLAPKLSEAGFHAVTVDLRGQGESSVPWNVYDVPSVGKDILAMIEHLNVPAAHVIGTSFAAAPAVWAAAQQPGRILSLVLIGAVVRSEKMNPLMQGLLWVMLNNPWKVQTWLMYYRSLYPSHKPADFKDYLQALRNNLSQPGRFHAAVALGGSSREPALKSLPEVKAPTLVIMGTKDPDFGDPAETGKFIAGQTHGRLELIEGAGHYPQTELPEKTNPLIIQFFQQHENQPTAVEAANRQDHEVSNQPG